MNIFKKLFGKSENNQANPSKKETMYILGWEIYSKDSNRIITRKYDDVPESKREETYNSVKADVDAMYDALNNAVAERLEFVNLCGNVLRTSDVTKICIVNHTFKPKEYTWQGA